MYTLGKRIAGGAFGCVFEAEKEGVKYAVKVFKIDSRTSRLCGIVFLKEVDLMKRCQHPAILPLHDVTCGSPFGDIEIDEPNIDVVHCISPFAVMNGHEYCRKYKNLTPAHIKRMMYQIVRGVEYLHVMNVAHRDIKSANILLFQVPGAEGLYDAKITDFGLSKQLTMDQVNSGHIGTVMYRSPEVILNGPGCGKPADVWALGVLFFEFFNSSYPFEGTTDKKVLYNIFKNRGCPKRDLFDRLSENDRLINYDALKKLRSQSIEDLFKVSWFPLDNFEKKIDSVQNFGSREDFVNMLENMLCVDPDRRYTIQEVADDQFFAEVPLAGSVEAQERGWFGLAKDMPYEHGETLLCCTTRKDLRAQGIRVFNEISVDINSAEFKKMAWRIVFLGIDIFDRALVAMEEQGFETYDLDEGIQYIAACSIFVASKFFLEEKTPSIGRILPGLEFQVSKLIEVEQSLVCNLLEWHIYRPTVYDILRKKDINVNILYRVFTKHYTVTEPDVYMAAEEFHAQLNEIKISNERRHKNNGK